MQCLTGLVPPTAVSHAISLPFIAADANNLLVARTSVLQVFAVKYVSQEVDAKADGKAVDDDYTQIGRQDEHGMGPEQSFLGPDMAIQRSKKARASKLVLIAEYELSGTVTSMGPVKILDSRSGGAALLIAFQDAKLSLIEWDPEHHSINTISIHYYEKEDLQRSPFEPDINHIPSILSVDPSSRCAVLKFGLRNLAILPFRQAGDDLVMDDYDDLRENDEDLGLRSNGFRSSEATQDQKSTLNQTPYQSSFVLPMSALDPALIHLLGLAFLYEYREPTFGVLGASQATSTALLPERRDKLSYSVFTLDLEQRASTAILSVTGLPNDLHRVFALPSPVGGALLIGGNEIVHVDQAGKTNAVAVNVFAKDGSDFGMADQSSLGLRLEDCHVGGLTQGNGDVLIMLKTGTMAIVSFNLDGRTVSRLSVSKVDREQGGDLMKASTSCVADLRRNTMFIGSEEADSKVVSWSRPSKTSSKQRNYEGDEEGESFEQDDMDYDDDLYSGDQTADLTSGTEAAGSQGAAEGYTFQVNDTLPTYAPVVDICFGQSLSYDINGKSIKSSDNVLRKRSQLDLVTSKGRASSGGLAIFNEQLSPMVIGEFEFAEALDLWTIQAKKPAGKGPIPTQNDTGQASLEGDYSAANEYHRYMIVSKAGEESSVYALSATGFEEVKDTEFDQVAGSTVAAFSMKKMERIVQILPGEVRVYDGDFGLAQIYPVGDEDADTESKVISATCSDSYLALVKSDHSLMILESDKNGDLEEIETTGALKEQRWLAASLYEDIYGIIGHHRNQKHSEFLFLLSDEGSIEIFLVGEFDKAIFSCPALPFLPFVLTPGISTKRFGPRATFDSILVADLGDDLEKSPYVILRSSNGDITIYQAFHSQADKESSGAFEQLRFSKLGDPYRVKSSLNSGDQEQNDQSKPHAPLRTIPNLSGYSSVFVPGECPAFFFKVSSSTPKLVGLSGHGIRTMSGFHTAGCEQGFVYIDDKGTARVCQLPEGLDLSQTGWVVKTMDLGEEVNALTYHGPSDTYVVATSSKVGFDLPDDEYHKEWIPGETTFKPEVDQGALQLVSPQNWTVIDKYTFQETEIVLCMKTMSLEISEHTHERKPLIVVGTCHSRIVDLPCRGNIYVFEVISVVPEPGRPEMSRKLKLVAREDVKGAVTALSEIGTQGFLLAAQGQKCMVRGLKDDGTLLPVAFIDMMCHVSVAKALPHSGLCLLADAIRGLWFVGYAEEPYKMSIFGKSTAHLEILAADFLPHEDQLYIVAADAESNLHVLQYDPEHPKSLGGTRLLHRTVFHSGHFPGSIVRIPSLDSSSQPPPQGLLLLSQDGSISLINPLTEPLFRRLSSLQSALLNLTDHPCGLNPRMYRAPAGSVASNVMADLGADGLGGGRGILDHSVLKRWWDLGTTRAAEVAARAGVRDDEVKLDLEAVSGKLGFI